MIGCRCWSISSEGGDYFVGDGFESRYDGGSMSNKGIVALTVNYRLEHHGFLRRPRAHEGIAESIALGTNRLLDQHRKRFSGSATTSTGSVATRRRSTIAGESAEFLGVGQRD